MYFPMLNNAFLLIAQILNKNPQRTPASSNNFRLSFRGQADNDLLKRVASNIQRNIKCLISVVIVCGGRRKQYCGLVLFPDGRTML